MKTDLQDAELTPELLALIRATRGHVLTGDLTAPVLVGVGKDGETGTFSLERYMPSPSSLRARVALHSMGALHEYLREYGSHTTVIFVSKMLKPTTAPMVDIMCHFDYPDPAHNRWVDHTAEVCLNATPEVQSWLSANDTWFSQKEFCEFLEDNLGAIVTDDAAGLLEMVSDLRVSYDWTARNMVSSRDGSTRIEFSHESREGSATLPKEIVIRCLLFDGADYFVSFRVRPRFRFDRNDGKVKFKFKIERPENELRKIHVIIMDDLKDVADMCSANVYNGGLIKGPRDLCP